MDEEIKISVEPVEELVKVKKVREFVPKFRIDRIKYPNKCSKCGGNAAIYAMSYNMPGSMTEYFISCMDASCARSNIGSKSGVIEKVISDWNDSNK
jgi:hypothetical protein